MGPSALAISAAFAIFAQAAPASPPSLTDPQAQTARDYRQCQRAAVKALDDGHLSEDAIATQMEKRCETQNQT